MKTPLRIFLAVLALSSLGAKAWATTYYVSPSGNDGAPGTQSQPFATVQFGVDRLNPGDVLYLRAGTYYETVTVNRSGTAESPITMQAYPGETVALVGSRSVAGPWTVHSGSVRRTAWLTQPVQVFCDGRLLNEARWPNAPLPDDIREQTSALTDDGSTNYISHHGLPAIDLTGAWLHVVAGEAWVGYSRQVAMHDRLSGRLSYSSPINQLIELIPRRNNRFFVFGKLELLDAPGEWWWDPVGRQLYVWTPDGAAPDGRVEAGEAPAVLNLSGQSHVTIKDLTARGGWFNLQSCTACRVEDCHLFAPTWLRAFDGFAIWPMSILGGIDVSGTGNTVQGGSVRLSGRSGIHLAGSDNTVRQMLIEDSGWNWTNNAAVDLTDSVRSVVENCTLRRTAGTGLILAPASRVLRNRVETAALAFEDCGNIVAWSMDGQGTEVAYNVIRGNNSRWGAGIYLDAGSRNFWIHDNYVDEVRWNGINVTGPNLIEHNTFLGMQHEGLALVPQSSTDGVDMSLGRLAHNQAAEPFPINVSLGQPVSLAPEYASFVVSTPLALPGPRRTEVLWSQMMQPGWSRQEVAMDLSVVNSIFFAFESPATAFNYTVSNLRFLPANATGDAQAVNVTGATVQVSSSGGATCALTASGPASWSVAGSNPFRGQNSLTVSLPSGLTDLRAYRGVAFELAGTAARNYQFQGYQDIDNGPEPVSGRGARLPADIGAPAGAPSILVAPQRTSVPAGSSARFFVTASGSSPLSYQWQKDGVNIGGATGTSFTIASVATGDVGSYSVTATNSAGSATSNAAILSVLTGRLVSETVTTGHNVTFSAANASGSIQWQVSTDNGATWSNLANNSTYSGVTTSSLSVANATSALNGLRYRFVATDNGSVSISPAVTLTVAQAFLPFPTSITVDSSGNLYVGDANANTIQKITSAGVISLLAGTSGTSGTTDGTGAAARFNQPNGLTLLASGTLMVSDTSNATLRSITSSGTVTTLAGSSASRGNTDGTGSAATFSAPTGIARDAAGVLYVADAMNHTIRRITAAGVVTTLVGSAGVAGFADGTGSAARFNFPSGIAVDGAGNIYVADTTNNLIRKITSAGVATTLAGVQNVAGFDDGTGSAALFNHPGGLAVDGAGNLYLADTDNSTIRKITPTGAVTTIAGLPTIAGLADSAGLFALFNHPQSLSVDASGNIFVADTGNATIRKIDPSGNVSTVTLTANTLFSPAFTTQPASQTVNAGTAVTFTVAASGSPTFQWQKDGANISGATGASYRIVSAATSDAGSYAVIATNSAGSVTSTAATLTVNVAAASSPPTPSGGGGAGAPTLWLFGALSLLGFARRLLRLQR